MIRQLFRVPQLLILAVLCLALIVPARLNAQSDPAPLRIVTSFKIDSMDVINDGFWMPEFGVAELLMQFRQDGKYYPWVLQSLSQPDDLTWKMTLRDNVKFQNGKPLTPERLVAAMERQMKLSPSTQGAIPDGTTVKVTGANEVTLTTLKPFPSLLSELSTEDVFPVYDVEPVDAAGKDTAKLVGAGIYTGPYSVTSLDDNQMIATRNDNYWQGKPALPSISVRFVSDPQARLLAVQNDEADIALYPPTSAKPVVDAMQGVHFNSGTPGTGGFQMYLNPQVAPFDNVAVRQAVVKSVDYDQIANKVFYGVFGVATGFYPPFFPFAIQNMKTDLPAAEKLLDGAGWTAGSDGIRVKDGKKLTITMLIYPQQPDLTPMSEALQAQLRKAGFDVQIQSVDDIDAAILKQNISWNAALISNSSTSFGGAPEPPLRRYFVSTGDKNYGKYDDPELDKLVDTLSTTTKTEDRNKILARIQTILVEEQVYAFPLDYSTGRVIVGDRYKGYQPGFILFHVSWQTAPSN